MMVVDFNTQKKKKKVAKRFNKLCMLFLYNITFKERRQTTGFICVEVPEVVENVETVGTVSAAPFGSRDTMPLDASDILSSCGLCSSFTYRATVCQYLSLHEFSPQFSLSPSLPSLVHTLTCKTPSDRFAVLPNFRDCWNWECFCFPFLRFLCNKLN